MAHLTVGRCWMACIILLALATFTLARPPQENQPMTIRFCGRDLIRAIDEVCVAIKSPAAFIDPVALNQSSSLADSESADTQLRKWTKLEDEKSDSLLRQCCVIGCTDNDLTTFCQIDRNQIMGAAMHLRSQEWDMDWLYEFLPRYGDVPTNA
ncbi:Insulin/IGF/relaxin-like peptide 3 [Daphnia pulex]|uniref:Insulin/IGF/relaxin-like peptide 3 n=1 Tax=Daphnia pulex TaxID=6669 RepID=E9GDP9_DAPPU|nr:Insulin/IGF/relaxin-like peptide 3 [Daphnia pulex]|eukprot:EFX82116.1 Insulin/IGF/relaxin-like peptide 3 [Daphnia pulex]